MKHYVLDTCVLLHDPDSITSFEEHSIYIPLIVIEELDKL
jgi:PhoH-like ATPase